MSDWLPERGCLFTKDTRALNMWHRDVRQNHKLYKMMGEGLSTQMLLLLLHKVLNCVIKALRLWYQADWQNTIKICAQERRTLSQWYEQYCSYLHYDTKCLIIYTTSNHNLSYRILTIINPQLVGMCYDEYWLSLNIMYTKGTKYLKSSCTNNLFCFLFSTNSQKSDSKNVKLLKYK